MAKSVATHLAIIGKDSDKIESVKKMLKAARLTRERHISEACADGVSQSAIGRRIGTSPSRVRQYKLDGDQLTKAE
jgi:DNA-binding NarL/FixJ family response regulator